MCRTRSSFGGASLIYCSTYRVTLCSKHNNKRRFGRGADRPGRRRQAARRPHELDHRGSCADLVPVPALDCPRRCPSPSASASLNDTETRSIHLAFAILLAYLVFPAMRSSPRDRVPLLTSPSAFVGAAVASYLFVMYQELAQRPGNLTTMDFAVACVGILLLLEAACRALGLALAVIAIVFLAYSLAGPWMPSRWPTAGEPACAGQPPVDHHRGVFGIAPGVSHQLRLPVRAVWRPARARRCGPLLHPARLSLLGHLRGGPAKAAVVASAPDGVISGSSIANVVTTGTSTIPMMKRVGFSKEKAGAGGKWPLRSTARSCCRSWGLAFLMVEYVGIPWWRSSARLLPAAISYIALLYIVHLEAL